MPAYFYHLTLELHPARSSPTTTFTPPPRTDIFKSELPVHRSTSWAAFAPPQQKYSSEYKSIASSSDLARLSSSSERPTAPRRLSHRTRPSRSEHHDSPVPVIKPPARPVHKRTQSFASQDWRFDAISIQSIDMNPSSDTAVARPRSKSLKHPSHAPSSGGLATKGKFIPSDLKDTEVGWGVVHLYRDGQETPGLYDDVPPGGGDFREEDCTTLCILAVPSYMTPSDFLGFVGEQTREHVSHFRLIRTSRANKYMVLMKFREAKQAREWRKDWNGKTFNSMEPEYCHVVFVKSISFQTDSSNRDPSSYPDLTNDPFTPAPTNQPTAPLPSSVTASSPLTTKPIPPPTPSLVELPTCPVCLERMDETTGLLTILCQHVFHCACLEKWRGSGCPVCRYTQNDAFSHSSTESPENECSVCGSTSNLWICLICGNIGCGRYDSAHAFAHYEATSHTYAMDVVSQHVWDYAGDGYVHRLIQNKADGKLVDLPASTHPNTTSAFAPHNNMTGYANDTVPREKVDNMGMEYAYLLTSQLESQRRFFEEQVERAADKAAKAASSADAAQRSVSDVSRQLATLKTAYSEAQASIALLEKESARSKTRAETSTELARKLSKQVKEEQTINESLMTRIAFLEKRAGDAETKVKEVEEQKKELEEQNRDLSFFISGQERLREMERKGEERGGLGEGELQSAVMEVGEAAEEKGMGKGKRKGKGRKK